MLKKLLILICSMLVMYAVNFIIPRLMPGDPFSHSFSGDGTDMTGYSVLELERLHSYYGLDKPLHVQFFRTVADNLKGDFGQSILFKKSVSEVLLSRLPWTLYIMGATLSLSLLLGLLAALLCLGSKVADRLLFRIMTVLHEMPSFLLGILLLFMVAANVRWIPLSGNLPPFKRYDTFLQSLPDIARYSLLPIMALVLVIMPVFFYTARTCLIAVRNKPFVHYARARGLPERLIRWRYILLNAILPLAARFFLSVGNCIGATLLIENVFAYPGLGKILRDAVMYRDFILIQGVFLLSAGIVIFSSFISDILNDFIQKGRAS